MADLEDVDLSLAENPPSRFQRWKPYFFLTILIALNLLNYMDRFTVAGMLLHIQNSFHINNSDAGLIVTVFVCCYMLAAPAFGYFGDRYNRKSLICLGLCIWSISVLLSSFCETFSLFLLSRAMVGVGEAAYATITPTIISDLFVDSERSRCLMLFYSALPIGSGMGYIAGASVDYATGSWRWGIRVTPLIGIILLIIMLVYFEEPPRGLSDHANVRTTTFYEDLCSLWNIKTYVFVTLAFTGISFVLGSVSWWTPTLCENAWAYLNGDDIIPTEIEQSISTTFGILSCIGGLGGVALGAMIARFWKYGCEQLPPPFQAYSITARGPRADAEASSFLVCGFGALAAIPAMWLALFTMAKWMFVGWTFIFFGIFLAISNMAITTDIILYITPPIRRSTAIAIQTLCVHLFGDATSPYIVGLLSDLFLSRMSEATSPISKFTALQYALFVPNFFLLFGGFYLYASEFIEKDTEYNRLLMHEMDAPSILDDDDNQFNDSAFTSRQIPDDHVDNARERGYDNIVYESS